MNIIQLAQQSNRIADEEVLTDVILGFANDAIARINVKTDANFPFFNDNEMTVDYKGFSETWQRALLIPFVVGRIKQTDSSQFEYSDAYGEFTDNLMEFQKRYPIPEEYKATTNTSYAADFSNNYWRWG